MFNTLQSPVKLENPSETPCSGCLSLDRRLWPLVDNVALFLQLLGSVNSAGLESKSHNAHYLCWECKALLQGARKFQLRIQQAHRVLQQSAQMFMHLNHGTLSNLTRSKIDTSCNSEAGSILNENKLDMGIIVEELKINSKSEITEIDNESNFEFPLEDIKIEESIDDKINDKEHKTASLEAYKPTRSDKKTRQRTWNLQIQKILKKHMETIEFVPEANQKHYAEFKFKRKQFLQLLDKERRNKTYTNKAYRCKICVIGFENEAEYLEHLNIHKQDFGEFSCKPCDRYFKSQDDQLLHQTHHYIGYRCNMCQFKSTKVKEQDVHVRARHKIAFRCKTCGLIFGVRVQYTQHYRAAHMRFECDYCGKVKRQKRMIEAHIRRYHTSGGCKMCSRTFSDFTNLEKHYRYVHKFELNGKRKTDSKPIVIENMYCVECDKQYETEYQYRKHLRNSARHATTVRYKSVACPQCGKVFTRMNYMKNHHRVVHENVSKHRCTPCDKNFVSSFSLRQHNRFVHDKIPLPKDKICAECGRAFSSNRVLTHHMRTHTGERPHACALCPARFARRDALNTHVKGHAGDERRVTQL